MSNKTTKTISVPSVFLGFGDTKHLVEIHQPVDENHTRLFRPDRADKKFTIRVKKSDLLLLDAIAANSGLTRSTILNKIVHDLLLDELLSVQELDAMTLIAAHADKLADQDDTSEPWINAALSGGLNNLVNNIVNFNVALLDYLPDDKERPLLTNSSNAAIQIARKLGYK